MQDTRNLKAGLIAVGEAFARVGWSVPVMASVTIEPMGTMLAGQAIDALYASIMHAPLLSIGLNCATGPEFMTDHIRTLSGLTRTLVSCYPNAGLPDVDGCYPETPERIAAANPDPRQDARLRHRSAGDRRRQPAGLDRRADQRARQPEVQETGGPGELRGGRGDRARPG